jgi:sugar phosphate isomerase/epimerase
MLSALYPKCSLRRSIICVVFLSSLAAQSVQIRWERLSSRRGELPAPGTSREQTGILTARIDKDSPATDFVMSFRVTGPALVWFRRTPTGWDRYVIEKEFLPIEAGGAAYDIDGDGDDDIVFGNDWQGNKLWWWENPYPNFNPSIPWKRHLIKDGGANQHHDQVFADFKGTGRPQLAFWNQQAKTIFLADIPKDPRHTEPWPFTAIFIGTAGERQNGAALYAEGMDAYDIDGDGRRDLLAGNYWFKYQADHTFKPIRVGVIGGRIRAGRFKPGKYPQIVIAPGDGNGPLVIYECTGNPENPEDWKGRRLLDRDMIHGHTLDIADIDGDGNPDILAAEQGKWTRESTALDNPDASAWILYGDGAGNFKTILLAKGEGWHDSKIADLDGDEDLDILQHPYAWDASRIDVWLQNGTGLVRTWTPRLAPSATHRPLTVPVGMELWTYRRELQNDLPATLAMLHQAGFRDIETASFYGRDSATFRKLLDEAGLHCSSLIAGYDRLLRDLDAVVRDAKNLDASYILTSDIPHFGKLTEADVKTAAAAFNEWGTRTKAAGIQFGYHPHGFEFVYTPTSTLFDVLAKATDEHLVTFELDTFWFAIAGVDPAAYLERYPDRFRLMHLKDLAKGTPRNGTGSALDKASVSIGSGVLRWPEILRAAQAAGVKRYFIEDESPDAPAQVPMSMRYLSNIGF